MRDREPRDREDREHADPTDPWEGLKTLKKEAIVGYRALVAATKDRPVYRVEGIVCDGNLVEITGPSGGGKTTLAMLLAAALANPDLDDPVEILNRLVTPIEEGQYVVIIEAENGKYSMRRKLEEAC